MIIKIDTREQYPWDFTFYGGQTKRIKVDTGDYTIDGLENMISIERKRNTGEIALNLGKKWKQFQAELDRMIEIKYKYIVCEFNSTAIINFPFDSGIPKRDWPYLRMNGPFIQKKLFSEAAKRGIEILFFDSAQQAEKEVYDILSGIYARHVK